MTHRMKPARPRKRRAALSGALIASLAMASVSIPQFNSVAFAAEVDQSNAQALPYDTKGENFVTISATNSLGADTTANGHAALATNDVVTVQIALSAPKGLGSINKYKVIVADTSTLSGFSLNTAAVRTPNDSGQPTTNTLSTTDTAKIVAGEDITVYGSNALTEESTLLLTYSTTVGNLSALPTIAFNATLTATDTDGTSGTTTAQADITAKVSSINVTTTDSHDNVYLGVYKADSDNGSNNPIRLASAPTSSQKEINLLGQTDGTYAAALYYKRGDQYVPLSSTATASQVLSSPVDSTNPNASSGNSALVFTVDADTLADQRTELIAQADEYLNSVDAATAVDEILAATTKSELDNLLTKKRTADDGSEYTYFGHMQDQVKRTLRTALFTLENEGTLYTKVEEATTVAGLAAVLVDAVDLKKTEVREQAKNLGVTDESEISAITAVTDEATTLDEIIDAIMPAAKARAKSGMEAYQKLVPTIRSTDGHNYDGVDDISAFNTEVTRALNDVDNATNLEDILAQYTAVVSSITDVLATSGMTTSEYRRIIDLDSGLAAAYATSRLTDLTTLNLTPSQVTYHSNQLRNTTTLAAAYTALTAASGTATIRTQLKALVDEMEKVRNSTKYANSTSSARDNFDDAYNSIRGLLDDDTSTITLNAAHLSTAQADYQEALATLEANYLDTPATPPNNFVRGAIGIGLGVAASGTLVAILDAVTNGAISRAVLGTPAPAVAIPAPAVEEQPAPEVPFPAPTRDNEPTLLSVTGASVQPYVLAALLLMVLGGTAFYIGRHRRWD